MNATTSSRGTPTHRHGRDWRPCPATMPPPLRPTKPIARWLFAWAAAFQHLETLVAFIEANRSEFPRLAGTS